MTRKLKTIVLFSTIYTKLFHLTFKVNKINPCPIFCNISNLVHGFQRHHHVLL